MLPDPLPRFAAVIFDLDGTLIGTERLIVQTCIDTLARHGHAVTRDFVVSLVGIAEDEGFARLCAHVGGALDAVAFNRDWSAANQAAYAKGIPLMPGVLALLAGLQAAGIPVAVATNSTTAGAWRKLRLAGLGAAFAHVVGFDLVPRPKPAPDVFLAAAAALGVAPARCLVFEDSATGVIAARAAGMTVVHVPDVAAAHDSAAHLVAGSLLEGALATGLIEALAPQQTGWSTESQRKDHP